MCASIAAWRLKPCFSVFKITKFYASECALAAQGAGLDWPGKPPRQRAAFAAWFPTPACRLPKALSTR